MKTKIKKITACVLGAVLLVGIGVGGFFGVQKIKCQQLASTVYPIETDINTLEINDCSSQGSFIFDILDDKKHVGFADYVFVARIDSTVGTTYSSVFLRDDGRIVGIPYTNYKVTVLKNIKGNLQTDIPIDFKMLGGISIDKKSFRYYGNYLLESGKDYVFLACVDDNGGLYVAGPNSGILLFKEQASSSNSDKSVDELYSTAITYYEEMYKNQDTSVRISPQAVSKYDISKSA